MTKEPEHLDSFKLWTDFKIKYFTIITVFLCFYQISNVLLVIFYNAATNNINTTINNAY